MYTFKDLHDMMEFPKEGIFSKVLIKGEFSQHTLMCLARGVDISEHTSTREAAVTVLQGSGIFVVKGEQMSVKEGTFLFMPKNTPHSLRADEDLAILLTLSGQG
jgi:nitric oxide dioxygenase